MLHPATTGVLATMSGRTVVPGSPAFGHLYSKVHASSGDATDSSAHVQMTEQRQCRKTCAHRLLMAHMGSTQTASALIFV